MHNFEPLHFLGYAPCDPEMSLGAYFQYEIYTSVFAVHAGNELLELLDYTSLTSAQFHKLCMHQVPDKSYEIMNRFLCGLCMYVHQVGN